MHSVCLMEVALKHFPDVMDNVVIHFPIEWVLIRMISNGSENVYYRDPIDEG